MRSSRIKLCFNHGFASKNVFQQNLEGLWIGLSPRSERVSPSAFLNLLLKRQSKWVEQ